MRERLLRQLKKKLQGFYQESCVNRHDLDELTNAELQWFQALEPVKLPCIEAPFVQAQQCHAVSAYLWLQDPSIQLYSGFALIEEEMCVDADWWHHSFCVKDGVILEPTPRLRDVYVGIPYTAAQTIQFVQSQLENIRTRITAFPIQSALLERFQQQYALYAPL